MAAFEIVEARSPLRALSMLGKDSFEGVYVSSNFLTEASRIGRLLQNDRILEGLPEGVVVLNSDNSILWANERMRQWSGRDSVTGMNFYAALNSPDILGPDFCPFQTALSTDKPSSTTLRSGKPSEFDHDSGSRNCDDAAPPPEPSLKDTSYFRIHASPVHEPGLPPQHLIVTVRDVTNDVFQQQKLVAIHQAGIELADMKPDEVAEMSIDARIDLLKSNILHFTKDLLQYDVVEIRMLEWEGERGKLTPLLAEGMTPEAENRVLYAEPTMNGVTGFVAATGKSYLCEDTEQDPLYLEGAQGAKSSLTVPLILHEKTIGTFNVESPEPKAFSENDLQFLEIFARDVAVALNTLQLLVAEKESTVAESCEAIHSAVALPIDDILNDAVGVMERYIGLDPDVVDRLQRILRNAREVKQVIQQVGQRMKPSQALPQGPQQGEKRPSLRRRRILVADADETVRSASHNLLERYGCIVETARDAHEALAMARHSEATNQEYDAIISDIRLPEMTGYELMVKLQEFLAHVPLILMTGYGYDPGHSIVKARQAGLKFVLYKPFRLDQLIDAVERTVTAPKTVSP
ncbi:MAG TPA: response regulator [Pirellulales bacterium]|nr:response regulator [Pirellulales bacterium]